MSIELNIAEEYTKTPEEGIRRKVNTQAKNSEKCYYGRHLSKQKKQMMNSLSI
jgi:hypothetical protein